MQFICNYMYNLYAIFTFIYVDKMFDTDIYILIKPF